MLANFFEEVFNADAKMFAIPTRGGDAALQEEISRFVARYQGPKRLLIVYYGGHGTSHRGLALWAA
jgi:hypothetical protein